MGCIIPILTLSLILILIISSFLFLSSAKAQSTTPMKAMKTTAVPMPRIIPISMMRYRLFLIEVPRTCR